MCRHVRIGETAVRGPAGVFAGMSWRLGIAAAVFPLFLLIAEGTATGTGAGALDELRGRVAELMAVRKAGYSARSDWEVLEKQLLLQEELLDRQLTSTQEKLAVARDELTTLNETRGTLETEKKALTETLAALIPPLENAEQRLRDLEPRLPPYLRQSLEESFSVLHEEGKPIVLDNVAERLQRVFSMFSEMRQFDAGIHLAKEILTTPEGTRREMDVLYIGLGAAFAVSTDSQSSARAVFTSSDWQWEWNPAWAGDIRRLVRIYLKEETASFVNLPMTVRGGDR